MQGHFHFREKISESFANIIKASLNAMHKCLNSFN